MSCHAFLLGATLIMMIESEIEVRAAGSFAMATYDNHSSRQSLRSEPIPISVVSNSLLLREGLVKLLEQYIDIRLVGSYPGQLDTLTDCPNPRGHTVLLDGA